MAESGGKKSVGGAEIVIGIVEVPQPPGEWSTSEEGEGRARNELRTTMEVMEVGGE